MAVIIGLSCKHTVMADLDNMSFKRVKRLALLTMNHFRLDGFIILKSSPNHYHMVFDKPMQRWSDVLKVIAWMQAIKGYCTLRVSPKPVNSNGFKPSPIVVYHYGSQNNMVKEYLTLRKRVLRIVKRARKEKVGV
ncbi:MAG: hypothetical protein QXH37_02275 [Candidatus Bathyarchaeia archaeon]